MMAAWVKCLYYNPTTQVLTYENIPGKSLVNILSLLQNLTIQKVDQYGNALWLDVDQTIPATTTVSAINSATAQALLNQYNSQGALPVTANGYAIGGGGKFMVSAHNIDLGTSAGIISKGAGLYNVGGDYLLRNYSSVGADILVNLIGSLDMLSSSVASLNGGNIYINAGEDVNVGSTEFVVNTLGARRVYSTGLGNVGTDALPVLAQELEALLLEEGQPKLAAQIRVLQIVDRCRCGDEFCATFYTVPSPSGSWGSGHQNISLDCEHGMLILDVVDDKLVCVEVLYRDEIRKRLPEILP